MNNPLDTPQHYQEYVNQKCPNSPILKNCFNSFWVGGLICMIGQFILEICKYNGLDKTRKFYNCIHLSHILKCIFNFSKYI